MIFHRFYFSFNLNQASVSLVNTDEWEIYPEQITFEEKLGEGSFGLVYAAKADVKSRAVQRYLQKKDMTSLFENKFAVKVVKGKDYEFLFQNNCEY